MRENRTPGSVRGASGNWRPYRDGERPGQASAFKMGYAGFTKGTTALLLELTLIAQAWGCLDALLATYASSHLEAFRMFTTHLRSSGRCAKVG